MSRYTVVPDGSIPQAYVATFDSEEDAMEYINDADYWVNTVDLQDGANILLIDWCGGKLPKVSIFIVDCRPYIKPVFQ